MVGKPKLENVIPPYLSYASFINFLNTLRSEGIPDRIDRSILRSMSGTLQAQLLSSLRYFKLIDDNNYVMPELEELVNSEGTERQDVLERLLKRAYPNILGDNTNGFRLSSATTHQFDEKFREYGISGDTVRKCQTFFLNAAKEAGIVVSSYIKPGMNRAEGTNVRVQGGPKKGNPVSQKAKSVNGEKDSPKSIPQSQSRAARAGISDTISLKPKSLKEVLVQTLSLHASKFPEFNPEWDSETQKNWLEGWERIADRLMIMSNQIQDSPEAGYLSSKEDGDKGEWM